MLQKYFFKIKQEKFELDKEVRELAQNLAIPTHVSKNESFEIGTFLIINGIKFIIKVKDED